MKFVSRAQWGAPATSAAAYIASTRGVKVHYLGSPYTSRSHDRCDDYVRQIRASHLAHPTENYADIAYSALVCEHGTVFEGRGAHRRTGANGTAALNSQHYAVCALLGSSGLTKPSDAMLGGIVDAIEWLRDEGDAGTEIKGHRDGHPTACPGDALYAWVQAGAPRPGGDAPQGGIGPVTPDHPARHQVTIDGLVYGYGATGPHVTAVGKALVAAGHGRHYRVGPGPEWTDADTLNYQGYQRSLGYTGADADGVPGPTSLRKLLGAKPKPKPKPKVPPFPGAQYFKAGANNKYVTQLGERLVARGFGKYYSVGPGPRWGDADRNATRAFQKSRKELRGDADGHPGPLTWKLLHS